MYAEQKENAPNGEFYYTVEMFPTGNSGLLFFARQNSEEYTLRNNPTVA